ncbi:NAD(P)-binding domain-containing protein [Spirochaeta dissipatitropha]
MSYIEAVVIGAGPIGIEIAANLKANGISYRHFEAGQIGNTISWWPRNTQFFSSPEWIAIAGIPIQTVNQELITGEQYLAYLRSVVEILDLEIETYCKVVSIARESDHFVLLVEDLKGREELKAGKIIFAGGDMAKPRMLGIEGEDLPHVSHYFTDPHRYFQKDLLIVGGRNSAMEAALRCWRAGARVSISYRRKEIIKDRVISRLFLEIELLISRGQIKFYPETELRKISRTEVELEVASREEGGDDKWPASGRLQLSPDFVLLCTGFSPDHDLLDQLDIERSGTELMPLLNPETMETNVPGVYVAGTAAAGDQNVYRTFITTSHVHAEKIVKHILPDAQIRTGNISVRDYSLSSKDIE